MTNDNWVTIALISSSFIAQLIAPTLASLVMSRINQPKPTPELTQPKTWSQRIGGWVMRVCLSPWILPPFAISLNIYVLIRGFRDTSPITRAVVLQISEAVAATFFSLLNMSLLIVSRAQVDSTREQATQTRLIVDVVKDIVDWMKRLDDFVHPVSGASAVVPPSPDNSTQRMPGRLLAAIRKVLAN
jgi:hypothetical protein